MKINYLWLNFFSFSIRKNKVFKAMNFTLLMKQDITIDGIY